MGSSICMSFPREDEIGVILMELHLLGFHRLVIRGVSTILCLEAAIIFLLEDVVVAVVGVVLVLGVASTLSVSPHLHHHRVSLSNHAMRFLLFVVNANDQFNEGTIGEAIFMDVSPISQPLPCVVMTSTNNMVD